MKHWNEHKYVIRQKEFIETLKLEGSSIIDIEVMWYRGSGKWRKVLKITTK